MNHFEDKRRMRIYEITAVVKLFSILFSGIIVFGEFPLLYESLSMAHGGGISLIATIGGCLIMILLIYEAWILSTCQQGISNRVNVRDVIEIAVFVMAFTSMILNSGAYASPYKFLYLFIIITSTIQLGMNCGFIVAMVSSVCNLVLDLVAAPSGGVNQYFETDLVLAGVFVLTAVLLGYYVKIEREYREAMTNYANMDELTGMYNHRYFQDSLTKEMKKAEKSGYSVSLLFIDIDYFKHYNDLYGHMAGDSLLKELTSKFKECIRPGDILARYGGEEFAIILADTGEQQAMVMGEKIRKMVEQSRFQGAENQPAGKITVSIGVSSYPAKAKNKAELLKSADDALYRAKFFDKNRVEAYTSILEDLKKDIEDEHIDLISSMKTLISVINAKDRYTYGHTERVVMFCEMLAQKLELPQEDKKVIKYGAYLHDIGKIQIPQEILNKKMPLTEEEWTLLKQHPENGVAVIQSVNSLRSTIPLILHHHERYDGKGYPAQLAGADIPYLARMLTVADSFDAMVSSRPYKSAKTYDEAVEELRKCSGSQFDPAIAEAFIEMIITNKNKLKL